MADNLWNLPSWFSAWSVASGALRIAISAFYLFAAIWLMSLKPSAVCLFTCALGLSIAFALIQLGAFFYVGSFMMAGIMLGNGPGAAIDLVLLLVIWLNDRSVFKRQGEHLAAT